MDTKIWLIEDFCPVDKYTCLMPVEYEAIEVNGVVHEYEKKKMACRHALNGTCEHIDQCKFFKKAPDKIDKNAKWHEE